MNAIYAPTLVKLFHPDFEGSWDAWQWLLHPKVPVLATDTNFLTPKQIDYALQIGLINVAAVQRWYEAHKR
jgi:hypothetical protein